jgi:hypothetical protein
MLPDEPIACSYNPNEFELCKLFFPENCQKQPGLRIEFDYIPTNLIPKLQVYLSSMAILGGAWKYGCCLQISSFVRNAEFTCTQSYAIVRSFPLLHYIEIYAAGDTTGLCVVLYH